MPNAVHRYGEYSSVSLVLLSILKIAGQLFSMKSVSPETVTFTFSPYVLWVIIRACSKCTRCKPVRRFGTLTTVWFTGRSLFYIPDICFGEGIIYPERKATFTFHCRSVILLAWKMNVRLLLFSVITYYCICSIACILMAYFNL